MDIGTRIKYYRLKKHYTQAKLAELADMEPNNLNRIERGKANPKLKTMLRLCDVLNITPNELLLYEYNAREELYQIEIYQLLRGCTKEEYEKIVDYIYYIRRIG